MNAKIATHKATWFDQNVWQKYVLPLYTLMGNQLAGVGMQQVMAIGMFIDAQVQLETQRSLQILHARANKDYQPSKGMCEFGTRVKSLASSERKGEVNALILSRRMNDRLLGNKGTGAAKGVDGDLQMRFDKFASTYCNSFDNNNSLNVVCKDIKHGTSLTAAEKARFNSDVDYQRFIQSPRTIDFDLTDGSDPSASDQAVFAMATNLYGFDSFVRPDFNALSNKPGEEITQIQQAYLDMRALVAKTKVAENSYNALVSLKANGTEGSKDFIKAYLVELGIPDTEIDTFLGEKPSYYAQMEILTKQAYQSPVFYTNLYDKPANVRRKAVAMQAIGMIQKFDLLKSYLRTEASLSVLLELTVQNIQRDIEDNIRSYSSR